MSKQDRRPSNIEKSRQGIRRSASNASAPAASTLDRSASSKVTGSTEADPVDTASATDGQGTNSEAPSDKPLASQAGAASSEQLAAGEQDQLNVAAGSGSTTLTSPSDAAALPAAAQVSTRRSQRSQQRAKQQSRRATAAGSTIKHPIRQARTASTTGTETNPERNNSEAVADKTPGESATATVERPREPVSSKQAPLIPAAADGAAADPPSLGYESTSPAPKSAVGKEDKGHKTNVSPRSAQLKSTVAELYTSFYKLEQMASGLARSPQSAVMRRTFAGINRKSMIICAGAAGFAFVALLITLAVSTQFTNHRKFCLTDDCVRHATLLTKNRDPNNDPCDDFSAYVCSAWHSSSDHSEQVTSVMDRLRFTWYEYFRDTLARGALKVPAGNKPLAMYDMCITGYPSGASQLAPFLELLRSYNMTWPELASKPRKPLPLIVELAYKLQSPFWISVSVLEPTMSGQQRILVSPGLYVPIARNQHRNAKLSYVKYWEQFLVHLYPDAATRPPMNVSDVENLRDVEGNILETLYSVMSSAKMQPAIFPFGELSNHVPRASASDWVESFQRGLALKPNLTRDDYMAVGDLSLVETVAQLLAHYDPRLLTKHLIWLFVQFHSLLAGYEFLKIHYGSERKAAVYLPAYCAHRVEVSYKVLILALGFYSLFTEQDRRAIDVGFDTLVAAAVQKVDSSEWMDSESKVRAAIKLASVKKALWPPASVLDSDELERIYASFPQKAGSFFKYWDSASRAASASTWTREYLEAFRLPWNNLPRYVGYNYILNSVELAIAVATPPAYYRNGTKAMLYGGLLFLMATQLVRAIDAEGLKWEWNGTAVNSILSDSTLPKFQTKARCNSGAGNRSVFPEIPALDIAYSALKDSYLLDESKPLPLGEDLPAEKVFFMTVCYLTCANPSGEYALAADCNKLVQNSEAFSQAFNCPKGSKMNPENKCSFFN